MHDLVVAGFAKTFDNRRYNRYAECTCADILYGIATEVKDLRLYSNIRGKYLFHFMLFIRAERNNQSQNFRLSLGPNL